MPTLDLTTRERIVRAATELFMERGYDQTTMRLIAERAEVSLGNTYYYFGGKEDLVQGFYVQIAKDYTAAATERMEGVRSFAQRLALAFDAFLDTCGDY